MTAFVALGVQMSGILLALAAQVAPFPVGPPRPPITDPIFAASPIREVRRAWDDCTWAMIQVMLMNGRSRTEADQWVFGGCADQESKLTGQLVKKYGYKAGNSAMERAKGEVRAELSRRYTEIEKEEKKQTQGVLANTGDWQVKKFGQRCASYETEQDFLGNTSTVISVGALANDLAGKYLLSFAFATRYTQQRDYPQQAELKVKLVRETGSKSFELGPFDAVITSGMKQGEPLSLLHVVLDQTSAARLTGRGAVWIQPIGSTLKFPAFHVGDVPTAINLLQRCS